MHPLNPQSGASPSALLTIARLKGLLMLADKYNIQVRWFEARKARATVRCVHKVRTPAAWRQ